MTTFVIKRDVVWLQSLPMSEPSGTMILLCEDGCHVVVPAVLLLAASPLLRTLMSDQLPPLYSPIVLSFPGVTEDVLQAVSDILATGRATGDMAEKIKEVKEVFKMLGVSESLVCCSLESIDVSNVFDKIQEVTHEQSEINANYLDIKLEVSIDEEMDTIEENETEIGRTKYVVSDVGGGKTARFGKSLQAVKQETEDIIKIQRAAFKATRKASPLNKPGTKLLAAKSNPGDNSTNRDFSPKDGKTFGSKVVGRAHPIKVGGVLSGQVVGGAPPSQMVGGVLSSQVVGGAPPSQMVGGAPHSMADPAAGSVGGTQQKVTIVKSADGKINVLGLLPGQQLVKLPNGKLQIFQNSTYTTSSRNVVATRKGKS